MLVNEILSSNIVKLATLTLLVAACHTPCSWDRQCPLDRVCGKDGYCTTNCSYDASLCGSGEVCFEGTCQIACSQDGDCPSNYCSNGICSIKPPANTTITHNTNNSSGNSGSGSNNNSSSNDSSSDSDSNSDNP